jgi:hypothetical protein
MELHIFLNHVDRLRLFPAPGLMFPSSSVIGFIDHDNNGANIPETRRLQGYLPQSVTQNAVPLGDIYIQAVLY